MKLLITGSSGFIGQHLVPFLQNKYDVHTFSLKDHSIDDLDLSEVDTIIHLAGLAHQMKGAPAEQYFNINTNLTLSLAEKAKKNHVKHFIFISTAHVYGDYGDLNDHTKRFTEDSPCQPIDSYGQSKLLAEQKLQALVEESFCISIVRPPMVYGEGAKGNLLNLYKLIKHAPVLPLGFLKNNRSIIYVGNLLHFIDLVIQKKKTGIFLPQDSKPVSIGELCKLISQAMNKKNLLLNPGSYSLKVLAKISPNIPKKLFGTLAFDSTKTNQTLGYVPPFSTAVGIQKMIKTLEK